MIAPEETAAVAAGESQATVIPQALAVGPDKGHKPPATKKITPEAVRNLRGFIDATGWKLIYGLNMGTETAERRRRKRIM